MKTYLKLKPGDIIEGIGTHEQWLVLEREFHAWRCRCVLASDCWPLGHTTHWYGDDRLFIKISKSENFISLYEKLNG